MLDSDFMRIRILAAPEKEEPSPFRDYCPITLYTWHTAEDYRL